MGDETAVPRSVALGGREANRCAGVIGDWSPYFGLSLVTAGAGKP